MRKSLPKPGKIQRGGGVGKLAAIAEEVRVVKDEGGREISGSDLQSEWGETESSRTDSQSVKGASEEISINGLRVRSTGDLKEVSEEISMNGLRVRSTGDLKEVSEEISINGLRVRSTGDLKEASEEISINGLRVRSTGINVPEILEETPSAKPKHYPMSNKNRALVAEYEKLHGKAQLPGESFRDMFDRVLGVMLGEKAIYAPDKPAISSLKLKAESLKWKEENAVREMLTI